MFWGTSTCEQVSATLEVGHGKRHSCRHTTAASSGLRKRVFGLDSLASGAQSVRGWGGSAKKDAPTPTLALLIITTMSYFYEVYENPLRVPFYLKCIEMLDIDYIICYNVFNAEMIQFSSVKFDTSDREINSLFGWAEWLYAQTYSLSVQSNKEGGVMGFCTDTH